MAVFPTSLLMSVGEKSYVLGLDLDGVVADFYGHMRKIVAEWRGVDESKLVEEVSYGFPEWDVTKEEYNRIHRFAVTQRNLFKEVPVIRGAPQAIRNLQVEGVRIRIITHRLWLEHFHRVAVDQTVAWLDSHAIPYWDLCFMKDKEMVDADIYIEDAPKNITRLQAGPKPVVAFSNSTNKHIHANLRADGWDSAEEMIRQRYYAWLDENGMRRPEKIGQARPH